MAVPEAQIESEITSFVNEVVVSANHVEEVTPVASGSTGIELASVHIEESLAKSDEAPFHNGNDSPNLSPVKNDATQIHNIVNGHVNGDGEGSSHAMNGGGEVMENGSINGVHSLSNGYDIMTTSFIEDSSNPRSR